MLSSAWPSLVISSSICSPEDFHLGLIVFFFHHDFCRKAHKGQHLFQIAFDLRQDFGSQGNHRFLGTLNRRAFLFRFLRRQGFNRRGGLFCNEAVLLCNRPFTASATGWGAAAGGFSCLVGLAMGSRGLHRVKFCF